MQLLNGFLAWAGHSSILMRFNLHSINFKDVHIVTYHVEMEHSMQAEVD